jgi:hypothetical protein
VVVVFVVHMVAAVVVIEGMACHAQAAAEPILHVVARFPSYSYAVDVVAVVVVVVTDLHTVGHVAALRCYIHQAVDVPLPVLANELGVDGIVVAAYWVLESLVWFLLHHQVAVLVQW